jgi:hypothetical protein
VGGSSAQGSDTGPDAVGSTSGGGTETSGTRGVKGEAPSESSSSARISPSPEESRSICW